MKTTMIFPHRPDTSSNGFEDTRLRLGLAFLLGIATFCNAWLAEARVTRFVVQTSEPFVAGADNMIDRVVDDIPDAEGGFMLIFSTTPFPGHQYRLDWRRADGGGNWYFSEQLGMEGWLCPALLRYFQDAPQQLYIQIKSRSGARA